MLVYQEVLSKMFDKNFKKRFVNIYKFSNHEINKLVLLLQKAAYPYQYMYCGEKFNQASLSETEGFCNHLNMEDITAADYTHAEKICKNF